MHEMCVEEHGKTEAYSGFLFATSGNFKLDQNSVVICKKFQHRGYAACTTSQTKARKDKKQLYKVK